MRPVWAVCIKQVLQDPVFKRAGESFQMDRERTEGILNPCDRFALDLARAGVKLRHGRPVAERHVDLVVDGHEPLLYVERDIARPRVEPRVLPLAAEHRERELAGREALAGPVDGQGAEAHRALRLADRLVRRQPGVERRLVGNDGRAAGDRRGEAC